MPSPFQTALDAKRIALTALKGQTVIYCADNFEIPVTARVGSTVFRIDTDAQFNARVRSRDYLIDVRQLINPFSQEPFEPTEGHRIKETRGEVVHTYECMQFGPQEPGWRYSDTTEQEFRIHTKRVSQNPL